jgi:hypothetical protein
MQFIVMPFVALLLFWSAPVWATPIVLTGGTIVDRSDQAVAFELQSAAHTLSCTFTCADLIWLPNAGVNPGTTVNVSGKMLFHEAFGSINVNGVEYQKPSGTWNFSVGSVVVPSGSQRDIGFSRPFTMTGSLTALNAQGQPALDLSVSGQGTAGLNFTVVNPPEVRDLNSLIFTFTEPGVGGGSPVISGLDLATVAAMPPSLLEVLQDCGMCAVMRDLGVMESGRRGVELSPLRGGFLSGPLVMEIDPAGGPSRLVNPEPTTVVLLLTGALWLILQRTAARGKHSSSRPNVAGLLTRDSLVSSWV